MKNMGYKGIALFRNAQHCIESFRRFSVRAMVAGRERFIFLRAFFIGPGLDGS